MVFMLCYLDGELVTALGTTTSEHGTAALGCHTSTEAVRTVALQYRRLKSAFHGDFYLNLNKFNGFIGYPPKNETMDTEAMGD